MTSLSSIILMTLHLSGTYGGIQTVHLKNLLDQPGPVLPALFCGVFTGMVATGLLLLRILNRDFNTPVAYELAVTNLFTVPVVGVCMFLKNGPL